MTATASRASGVFVHHLSHALGGLTRTLEEAGAADALVSSVEALREAGFRKHHVCAPTEDAYALARAAVEPLRPHLSGTGVIVYATCLPENGTLGGRATFERTRDVKHLMDFPASHLQADFGLDQATVVGLNQQACTGMLGALRLARALLAAEPNLARILCVTADRFPPPARFEQAYNLVSDGAAACLVTRDPGGFRLLACHARTNGALSLASDEETIGGFFSHAHSLIGETLARAGLGLSDVRWIVPQNTHVKAWQILARLLPFDPERVFLESMPEVGHVISGDNIVNLERLDRSGRLAPGDLVLLFMAGFGLNWQCVLLEKT